MKTSIIFLLLFSLMLASCETTQEPKKEADFRLIGSVNFELKLKNELGHYIGDFNCNYYLSNTKIELLFNNEVIETTYPKVDTTCDMIYVLENVEYDKPYKIRVTINDEMVEYTDEFIINKSDVINIPNDSITKEFTDQFQWFEEGLYYSKFFLNKENNANFNLYSDEEILTIYPNPIISEGTIEFLIESEGSVEIVVNSIDKSSFLIVYRDCPELGEYSLIFAENLNNGLYFVKMIYGGRTYYCPFLKGTKGAPPLPG